MTRVALISPLATFAGRDDRQAQLDEMNYGKYLKTKEWYEIRRRKLAGNYYWQCEECGAWPVELDVHHLRYPKRGTETNEDLKMVCRGCHNEIHGVKE